MGKEGYILQQTVLCAVYVVVEECVVKEGGEDTLTQTVRLRECHIVSKVKISRKKQTKSYSINSLDMDETKNTGFGWTFCKHQRIRDYDEMYLFHH